MPFIKKDRRDGAMVGTHNEPGDRCFRHYKALMDAWRESRRWTTIDVFAQRIWSDDEQRAAGLALLVFMHKEGFRYEDEKAKENGEV